MTSAANSQSGEEDSNSAPVAEDASQAAAQIELAAQIQRKVFRFGDLARCGDEIWIEHNGQLYRLRKTRLDKLILTK